MPSLCLSKTESLANCEGLADKERTDGIHTVCWDGNDKNGYPVCSDIYFYKLDAGDFAEVKKMVLIE